MTTYTDDQACVEARVENATWQHRKTIPAWTARDRAAAAGQVTAVRTEVRAEVGPGVAIHVRITPGYCETCKGVPVAPDPLRALAVMVKALAAQNGYAENTATHTSTEIRAAWHTVLELSKS